MLQYFEHSYYFLFPISQTKLEKTGVENCFKVPKHEIFLTELIILSYPIWTGDLWGLQQKIDLYEM